MYVFGSALRDDFRPGQSDVDLLVEFGPIDGHAKAHAYFDLLDELRRVTEPNWSEMLGGYRLLYDPRSVIGKLRDDPLDSAAWAELWNELHHQGDVGEASYAAVPLLVDACSAGPRDWNLFALVATIEVERHRRANPPLPDAMADDYASALARARDLALADLAFTCDPLVVRSALAVVALADDALELGALLSFLDTSEITELGEQFLAWDKLYDVGAS